MPVDQKGKQILEEVNFESIREQFIDSIMRKISEKGSDGCDLRKIIEESLREEQFKEFLKKLTDEIKRQTLMNDKESEISASYLIQEDIGDEISSDIKGKVEEAEIRGQDKIISEKGEKERLWSGVRKLLLGERQSFLNEILEILRRHFILRLTILTGILFLIISAILFQSVYKAILVGLTLTAFDETDVPGKIANLLGGIGGILIFFTSFSIVLQHFLAVKSRDELVRELARRFLEERSLKNKSSKNTL